MFAGRAAVAGLLARKRNNASKQKSIFELHQDKVRNIVKEPKISYHYRPYGAWFLGIVFICMSLFLIYVLS